jgi:thiamine-phosphate pyrophosphorylase
MKASLPRFYPILDTGAVECAGLLIIEAATAVLDAGAGILQLRHKEHFDRRMFETSRQVAALCRKAGALFVINDRADMAVLLDAALHVGQDDLPAIESRALIGSGRLLGVSTHNEVQVVASNADPVDYVAIGPMFETGSKRNPDPVVGVGELSRLRRLTRRPVVAIGGIKRENCRSVLEAGADSVAVIGDLFPPGCSLIGLQQRAEEWMRATNG